jgi:DnaJ-class molecular chaperone
LKLRKLKFKADNIKYEEAKNDERQYREHVEIEREKEVFNLTEDQRLELKKKFRKATVLCHPDKVSEEFKDAAQRIFIELKEAYDASNLQKVNELLSDLEKGSHFKARSETVFEKDLLKAAIAKLKRQIKSLEKEIVTIKLSSVYKVVSNIKGLGSIFQYNERKAERRAEFSEDGAQDHRNITAVNDPDLKDS